MTIEYKDSKRIVALSTVSLLTSSDYTSGNFTTVGSTVTVTNNSVVFSSTPSNSDNGQYKQITALEESDVWSLDFQVNQSSGNTYDNVFLGLSSGSSAWQTSGQTEIKVQTQGTGYMRFVLTTRISGSNSQAVSSNNSYSYNTDYYGTLSSDGTDITLKIWTSSARSGTPSITLTTTASGLGTMNYIQHRSRNTGDSNTWSGTVSNVALNRTPAKPTNVQDNSLLIEKDVARRYWSSGYSPANTATFTDDFSSDNWTDSDSTNIGVSGGALTWSMKRDNTNDASVRDLTSTSDNWVLRFKVTQGSSIGSTGAGNGFFFGISDSDQSVAQNGNQDFVGMAYYYDNQSEYNAMDSDGTALPHLFQGDAGQNFTITANDVFYFEIIKNGSSYTVEAFSNSDYSTGSLGKITGTTTATGLRYLKIMNELTNGSIPTSTNPFNGTIDDLKFYNNVTNVDSVPATWTMQPTLEDDFTTDNFAQTGTEIDVSGGELVWDAQPDGTTTGGYIDFGENLSDTAWVCRFKVQVNNYSGAVTTATNFFIQLQSITTVDSTTSRDSMGIHLRLKSGNTDWRVEAVDGSVAGGGAGNLIDGSATTETIYVQMYRDGNTIYAEWYDNANYTGTPTNTANHSSGTPVNLRYFAVYRRSDTTTTAVSNGIIDDLKIYNGVTSIN